MTRETILNCSKFDKPFDIYTHVSNRQLGAVISRDDKPLAFYSRKLNRAQGNYSTTKQELLSIVETYVDNIEWSTVPAQLFCTFQ